jgi:metal-dependent amidase/aminoacylase/carboxypeptidase family protein
MTSSKIDQKNVKQYVALARANFSDAEMSAYEQQGRNAIIESIPDLGIFETAQANAAKVLVPMFTAMGYEEHQVTVAFRKHYDAADIQNLIRMED